MTDNEPEAQRKLSGPASSSAGTPEPAPVSPPPPDSKGQNSAAEAPLPPGHASEPKPLPAIPARPIAPVPPSAPEPEPEPEPAPAAGLEPDQGADSGPEYEDEDPQAEPDDDDAEPEVSLTISQRLRRVSPALVTMAVGSIGSAIFLAFAMTSHTTPVSVLLTAAVVTGLIFLLDSVVSAVISVRAALNGESGRALLYAMIFGVASVTCAGSFAALVILCITLGYF